MEAALNSSLGRTVLGPSVLRIGRAPDNALVIQDLQASSHHTEIAPSFGGNSYQITDLESTNGTFVNEQRLLPNNPRMLNSGDVIRIGAMTMTYEMSGVEANAAPTVAVSEAHSAPTVAVNMPTYEPTVAGVDPFAQPMQPTFPPQQAYNYTVPVQSSYPPPPVYPQPQAAYPQEQPMYPSQPNYAQQGYPQPAYPQPGYSQPGFSQPGMPAPRKSRTGLFIAIAVILVVIVGGGAGAFFYVQSLSSPQKTLQTYCNALKSGDYQTAYNQFSSRVQKNISESQFAGLFKLALDVQGGITDCTVTSVTQDSGTTAHGFLSYTFGNGKTQSGDGPLVLENGTWKLDASATSNP